MITGFSIKQEGDVNVITIEDHSANTQIELRDMIIRVINNDANSAEFSRFYINTMLRVNTVQEAASVLNHYKSLAQLPVDSTRYKIALRLHGDPATLGRDAGVNWDKGGWGNRLLAGLETFLQTVDAFAGMAEMKDHPILLNSKVEVFYDVDKAWEWVTT